MAEKKARYKLRNVNGTYDVIHFETVAEQVRESDIKQFVSLEEKELLKSIPVQYTHYQIVPERLWYVSHKMNKFPSVTIVDSANTVVYGEIDYIDKNTVKIYFKDAFSGMAYFN